MRALFASTRGTGHLTPLLPFVGAWVARGHEALVAGPGELVDAIEGAGYEHWPVDDPPADELDEVWSQVPTLSPEGQNEAVVGEIFAGLNVRGALPRMRKACETWKPDVVVREPNEYSSAIAADLSGLPHARVAISLGSSEEYGLATAASRIDAHRRAAGLPPDPRADVLRGAPYLTAFPASLEDPESPGQPDTLRFRDPGWEAEPRQLPDWWDGDERPLVYVTFGSVAGSFDQAAGLFGMAMQALPRAPSACS